MVIIIVAISLSPSQIFTAAVSHKSFRLMSHKEMRPRSLPPPWPPAAAASLSAILALARPSPARRGWFMNTGEIEQSRAPVLWHLRSLPQCESEHYQLSAQPSHFITKARMWPQRTRAPTRLSPRADVARAPDSQKPCRESPAAQRGPAARVLPSSPALLKQFKAFGNHTDGVCLKKKTK